MKKPQAEVVKEHKEEIKYSFINKKRLFLFTLLFLLLFCIVNARAENDTIRIATHLVNVTEPANDTSTSQKMQIASTNQDSLIESTTSLYIKKYISNDYFDKHFAFDSIDNRGNIAYVKYTFDYDGNEINMQVAYDAQNNRIVPQMSSFLKKPLEITFSKENANLKANELNLPKPRISNLVYSSGNDVLAWKLLWDHEPTNEERANNTIQGYLFDATSGDIVQIYNYHYEFTEKTDNQPSKNSSIFERIWTFITRIFHRY